MDDTDFAWACGFFEGEGCIYAGRKGPRGSSRPSRRLCLNSTDRDVLERFHRIVGIGKIGKVHEVPGRKPIWQWYVYRRADIVALLDRMEPQLGARRLEQAAELRARL